MLEIERSELNDFYKKWAPKYMAELRKSLAKDDKWIFEADYMGPILQAEGWNYERLENDTNFWHYYKETMEALGLEEPNAEHLKKLKKEAEEYLSKFFKCDVPLAFNSNKQINTDAHEWVVGEKVVRMEIKTGFFIERAGRHAICKEGVSVELSRYWLHMRGPFSVGDGQALLLNIWGDFTNAKTIHDIFSIAELPLGTTGSAPKTKSMKKTKREMKMLKEQRKL